MRIRIRNTVKNIKKFLRKVRIIQQNSSTGIYGQYSKYDKFHSGSSSVADPRSGAFLPPRSGNRIWDEFFSDLFDYD
jgi:hypothetical protein